MLINPETVHLKNTSLYFYNIYTCHRENSHTFLKTINHIIISILKSENGSILRGNSGPMFNLVNYRTDVF